MYICHCNKCEKEYEDTNHGSESIWYWEEKDLEPLLLQVDEGGFFHGCPHCMTDGFLADNKKMY